MLCVFAGAARITTFLGSPRKTKGFPCWGEDPFWLALTGMRDRIVENPTPTSSNQIFQKLLPVQAQKRLTNCYPDEAHAIGRDKWSIESAALLYSREAGGDWVQLHVWIQVSSQDSTYLRIPFERIGNGGPFHCVRAFWPGSVFKVRVSEASLPALTSADASGVLSQCAVDAVDPVPFVEDDGSKLLLWNWPGDWSYGRQRRYIYLSMRRSRMIWKSHRLGH